MLRLRTLALLILVVSAGVFAGPVMQSAGVSVSQQSASKPATVSVAGVSRERLKRLDAVLQEHVDENRIAGIVVLVLRDGKPIYERALGWSDKESNRPMKVDSIFRIASQTKALTSAAILALMDDGRLTPSMPVSRFIPAYAKTTVAVKGDAGVATVPARRSITIADLLTHTAGISYGTDSLVAAEYEAKGLGPAAGFGWYTADKDEGTCDSMERLATLPFVAQPGESYVYGYNTDILGCVVERASGMPLDRFVAERITKPLGMKDTHFFLPAAERDRLATVYSSGPDGTVVRAPDGARGQGHYVDGPRKSFSGGAGLLSTARDYARFLEMTRNGGTLAGVRVLSPQKRRSHDDEPERDDPLDHRARIRLRIRDRGSLWRARLQLGRRLPLGRGVRVELHRRSRRQARAGVHDPADPEPHRSRSADSGAGLSGPDRSAAHEVTGHDVISTMSSGFQVLSKNGSSGP